MNKLLVFGGILVVVAIVAIAGVAGFILLHGDDESEDNTSETSQNDDNERDEESSDGDTIASSISDLFESEDSVVCRWEDTGYGTGEIYISNGRMRQNFTTNSTTTSVIYNDEYVYIWDNASSEGTKYASENLDGFEESLDETAESYEQYDDLYDTIDFSSQYDFDCDDWNADNSLFEEPSNVSFTDIQELFDSLEELNYDELDFDF